MYMCVCVGGGGVEGAVQCFFSSSQKKQWTSQRGSGSGFQVDPQLHVTCRLLLLQGELLCCTDNPTEACQPFLSALTHAKLHNMALHTATATLFLAYVQVPRLIDSCVRRATQDNFQFCLCSLRTSNRHRCFVFTKSL